jgi:hypothetical protein
VGEREGTDRPNGAVGNAGCQRDFDRWSPDDLSSLAPPEDLLSPLDLGEPPEFPDDLPCSLFSVKRPSSSRG